MAAAKNLILSLLGYGASPLLALVGAVLGARALGPAGRGELAAMLAIPTLLTPLAYAGMLQTVMYFTSRQPGRATAYLSSAFLYCLILSFPIILLGYGLNVLTLSNQRSPILTSAFLFLCSLPVVVIIGLTGASIASLGRLAIHTAVRAAPQLLYVFCLALAFSLHIDSPEWVLIAYLLFLVLVALPATTIIYCMTMGPIAAPSLSLLKEMIPYSLITALRTVLVALSQRVDQVIIAAFLPAEQLGYYAVAASCPSVLLPIGTAIGVNVLPALATREAGANRELLLGRTLRWTALVVICLSTILALAIPSVLPPIFGGSFRPSVIPAIVLTIAGAFLSMNNVLADFFQGLGRPMVPSTSELLSALLSIALLLLAVPSFGILAAAWISLLSYALSTFILLIMLWRSHPLVFSNWVRMYQEEAIFSLKYLRNQR